MARQTCSWCGKRSAGEALFHRLVDNDDPMGPFTVDWAPFCAKHLGEREEAGDVVRRGGKEYQHGVLRGWRGGVESV